MKNYILLLVIAFAIFSCKKEETVEYSTDKTMTAKLEGNLWRAVTPTGLVASGFYVISGESKIGHKINLYLPSVYVGEYVLATSSIAKAEYISADANDGTYTTKDGEATSGKIIITSLDVGNKKATGTFYFKANKLGTHYSKTISAGEFTNIEYIDIAPNPANNVMAAVTNGNQWIGTSVLGTSFTSTNQLQVNGTDGIESINIIVPSNVISGTYAIDGNLYKASYTNMSEGYSTTSGNIIISTNNTASKTLVGSFAFETTKISDGSVHVSIASGTFSVVYTVN
jgi:hypothetical protein